MLIIEKNIDRRRFMYNLSVDENDVNFKNLDKKFINILVSKRIGCC
jgi:hypothetical protein